MMNRLRLWLALRLLPPTHRAIEVEDDVSGRPSVARADLIGGGDALARGWGCHPSILYNGAAEIERLMKETVR